MSPGAALWLVVATTGAVLVAWLRPRTVAGRSGVVGLLAALAALAAAILMDAQGVPEMWSISAATAALIVATAAGVDLAGRLRRGTRRSHTEVVSAALGSLMAIAGLAALAATPVTPRPLGPLVVLATGATGACAAALLHTAVTVRPPAWSGHRRLQERRQALLARGFGVLAGGLVGWLLGWSLTTASIQTGGELVVTAGIVLIVIAVVPPRWLLVPGRQHVPDQSEGRQELIRFTRIPEETAARMLHRVLQLLDGEAGEVTDVDGRTLAIQGRLPPDDGHDTQRLALIERDIPRVAGTSRLRVWSATFMPLLGDAELRSLARYAREAGLALDRVAISSVAMDREQAAAEAQALAQLGNFSWDVSSGDGTWSDELYRTFGVDPASFELTLEGFRALIHPDDLARIEGAARQALTGQVRSRERFRIIRPDGGVRVLEVRLRGVTGPDGTPTRLAGVTRDVTEEERRLDALERHRVQLRQLARRLAETQDQERRSVGLRLHDEVGQLVTAMELQLASHRLECDAPALNDVDELLSQLHGQVRGLAADLRLAVLDDLGLTAALRGLAARARDLFGLEVDLRFSGFVNVRHDSRVETAAYRIAQEAVTNAARHAGVDTVAIELTTEPDAIVVQVTDAGAGFNPHMPPESGIGLSGMEERAAAVEGLLRIDSTPGRGTTVAARLPTTRMIDPTPGHDPSPHNGTP